MKEEEIIEHGKYYCNNDTTIDQAAQHFGVSRRTYQLHLEKFSKLSTENSEKLALKRQSNMNKGVIFGGTIGKKQSPFSDEQVDNIFKTMIAEDLTLRGLSAKLNISKSTLSELSGRVSGELKLDLGSVIEAHKSNKPVSEELKNKYTKR